MLFDRSLSIFSLACLKQHMACFNFRCWIQLDLPVSGCCPAYLAYLPSYLKHWRPKATHNLWERSHQKRGKAVEACSRQSRKVLSQFRFLKNCDCSASASYLEFEWQKEPFSDSQFLMSWTRRSHNSRFLILRNRHSTTRENLQRNTNGQRLREETIVASWFSENRWHACMWREWICCRCGLVIRMLDKNKWSSPFLPSLLTSPLLGPVNRFHMYRVGVNVGINNSKTINSGKIFTGWHVRLTTSFCSHQIYSDV